MLTNKNCKFLFYNFNNYLNRISQPIQLIRHTKISENDFALKILQEKKLVLLHQKNTRRLTKIFD